MIEKPIDTKNKKVREVIYLDDDFNIVGKEKATLVKIYFEDDTLIFGIPEKSKVTVKSVLNNV